MQCSAVQCNTLQCSAVQCNAGQCSAVSIHPHHGGRSGQDCRRGKQSVVGLDYCDSCRPWPLATTELSWPTDICQARHICLARQLIKARQLGQGVALGQGAVPGQGAGLPVQGAAGRKDWRKYRRRAEEEEAGSVGERGGGLFWRGASSTGDYFKMLVLADTAAGRLKGSPPESPKSPQATLVLMAELFSRGSPEFI